MKKIILAILVSALILTVGIIYTNKKTNELLTKNHNIQQTNTQQTFTQTDYEIDNTTPKEAVKYNNEIIATTNEIIKNDNNDLSKAESIYNWITKNIKYNKELENKVISKTNTPQEVSAINTFNTRSGICFGYSTLYMAMCHIAGLKVKIVGGYVYNSSVGKWQDHAWNQVYCNGTWANVDCTYGVYYNEFNTNTFNKTHMETMVDAIWN